MKLVLFRLKLRRFGVKYGVNVRGNGVALENVGNIFIGNNVALNSYTNGSPFRTGLMTYLSDAVILIGNNCLLNGVRIHCRTNVDIGNDCMFGSGVMLIDNDSHRTSIDVAKRREPPVSMPITLQNNVWIGSNSIILKGVGIGENSIVAANSVVTKNVPSNTLVAGNPARVIKTLTE